MSDNEIVAPYYMTCRMLRERERKTLTGIPTSSWYEQIKDGLAPPGVKISNSAVAWPENELVFLNAARIAGKSDKEIRSFVATIMALRANALRL